MEEPKKVAIIGMGQQGTSIAMALLQNVGGKYRLSTYDENISQYRAFYDRVGWMPNTSFEQTIRDADIVILATPIDKFSRVLREAGPYLKKGVTITDIGSVKMKAIREIQNSLPKGKGAKYIPAHPIAGKAGEGPGTADANMYKGEKVIIVPQGPDLAKAQEDVAEMWRDMGAEIEYMDPKIHDRLYGTISHFEHVVAFALTAAGEDSEEYKLAGNSMRDTTRIAKASAAMWNPIFADNREFILEAAKGFKEQLQEIKKTLSSTLILGGLYPTFNEAHKYRSSIESDRKRESLLADAFDLQGQKNGADIYAGTTGLPLILAAALALNARDTEKHLFGTSVANFANPSFKDGTAPVLTNPRFASALTYVNRRQILTDIIKFEKEFDMLVSAIERNDQKFIADYIKRVSSIRSEMPAHRTAEEMRPDFVR